MIKINQIKNDRSFDDGLSIRSDVFSEISRETTEVCRAYSFTHTLYKIITFIS